MKVLSLFSGVGGFDMGLSNANMQTVFQCEWDKHANSILHRHWPDVPKWDDVSTLTGKHILANAPVIDVVAWGSPCQDLSVAGKRAGLEGGRSGLFHEGIRIIKELQEESNGQYPRISIWENVVGALNSNRGADFGVILDEMAQAGALVIEWAVLDAQYFGVPQRRRRVFVIAIFDPVLANRCPNPLLPVSESLPGHLTKGKPQRKSAARTLTEGLGTDGQWAAGTTVDGDILRTSVTSKWSKGSGGPSGSEYYNMVVNDGAWWDGRDTAEALTTTSNEQRMPDKQRFQAVVEGFTPSSFANYTEGVGTLRSNGGDLGGGSETLIAEPYVKSSRAQTSEDSETWIPGEVNPTLNSFDVGDTRATTAIVEPVLFENSYRDGARIANDGVSQTLTSKMGTGGGNTPMIAIPIQDGRDIEKHQNGLGVAETGSPSYTLDQTGAQAVAIGIQGNVIGRQDHNGPAGKGHTEDGDPMFTLTSTDIHAVASTMAVRRLTPLECERLMGWPDNHTLTKADGTIQADSHRYKQCGNGVASPVAQWIAKHILEI